MTTDIGWRFPPTNGGRADGFNDPGTIIFKGAELASLARETIQNSLDAPGTLGSPVSMSFELRDLAPSDVGRDELAQAIELCVPQAKAQSNPVAEQALNRALQMIKEDKIPCLRVSDRNTTGLRGEQWRALVKMQGVSLKPDVEGAGGSHGIGKYAPFVVSTLRTVFYWTCYEEDGRNVECFQGKSVLMSHEGPEGETQGTGFYGIKHRCRELRGQEIPETYRVLTADGRPVHGTSLTITGFRGSGGWRRRIAQSIVENYFYAIHNGNLSVIIEPDVDSDLMEINQSSLGNWFTMLLEEDAYGETDGDEDGNGLIEAREFWKISTSGNPTAEKQDTDLGHCRLWIRVEDGLPSKVGFVRRNGMLVTTEQPGLIRFRGFRDFAALCVFEDGDGNELLRRMENPQHDKFQPERLPEDERARGRRALKRVTDWIRSEVRKSAGPSEGEVSTVLSELAAYLPDLEPDEPIEDMTYDGDGSGEPGFGDRVRLTLKPVRRSMPPVLPAEEEGSEDGDADGDDTGSLGGAGTENNGSGGETPDGPGEGEGYGGTGSRGGGQTRPKRIPISNVRILSIEGRQNSYQLSFRADGNGVAKLDLEETGDSSAIRREDVRVVSDNLTLDRLPLVSGERMQVEITADAPIGGRAWRLSAAEAEGDQP